MKKTTFILVILIMFFALITTAFAVDPLSETYWYSDPGDAGAYTINYHLGQIGYDNNIYSNTSAYKVRRTMDDDAVFAYVGHGEPGRLLCSISDPDQISAKIVSGNDDNYSLQAAFYSTTDKLKTVRLAYLGACYSDNYSSTYGRLTTYLTSTLGVDCAIGFTDEVFEPVIGYFEGRLFAHLDTEATVQTALNSALADCISEYGATTVSASNVDDFVIRGSGSIKIDPAAYGTY